MSYKGNESPTALKDFIIFDYTLIASSARNGGKESELPYDSYFGRYCCCDINSRNVRIYSYDVNTLDCAPQELPLPSA